MASASSRARGDAVHELIGMEAALHQELALGASDHLDGLIRCRVAMGNIDDFVAADIECMLVRYDRDLGGWPDQGRDADADLGGLDSTPQ